VSADLAARWRDAWVTPRGMLLFGFLVALLTAVVLVLCWPFPRPNAGVPWGALLLLVPFLEMPAALCAWGLWLARDHPLLPWVKEQAWVVLAFGFAALLADVIVLLALIMLPDIGAAVFFLYGVYGQLIFWALSFLGLRILVYLLRWHLGARPDGWHDPE
jgi:hypothetical protein